MAQALRPVQRAACELAGPRERRAQGRDVLYRWLMSRSGLSHLDSRNRPAMVDVGAKEVTHRVAEAEARIRLPRNVALALRKSGHRTKKGPVFDTAIVSGVMAAKRTHELIPFCHPLGLDSCTVEIEEVSGQKSRLLPAGRSKEKPRLSLAGRKGRRPLSAENER